MKFDWKRILAGAVVAALPGGGVVIAGYLVYKKFWRKKNEPTVRDENSNAGDEQTKV